jgi:hypothetical protein
MHHLRLQIPSIRWFALHIFDIRINTQTLEPGWHCSIATGEKGYKGFIVYRLNTPIVKSALGSRYRVVNT